MMEILIMGRTGSGKSSIKRVVFEKLSPYESVFNDPTTKIERKSDVLLGITTLAISEIPACFSIDEATPEEQKYFKTCGMLIYVFDSQDPSNETFEYFENKVLPHIKSNPQVSLTIFIHKSDSVNINQGDLTKQKGAIQTRFKDILSKAKLDLTPTFYTTSIYDYSLFETFSKIFQKMMKQNSLLSNLLDILAYNCNFERAYLFDVFNKIYLAIDSSPMESQTYEICSDMIDVVLDMSGIYGDENNNDSYFDDNSSSLIRIKNSESTENDQQILYLRFVDSNLALICIVNETNFQKPQLLDYNIKLFRNAVKEILNKS